MPTLPEQADEKSIAAAGRTSGTRRAAAPSRTRMSASAAHGRRPAAQSRMTAASIISRSASGSANLPNSDSTCQRRARQPSTWSVIAGDAEDDRRPASCGRRRRAAAARRRRGSSTSRSDRERVRELRKRSRDAWAVLPRARIVGRASAVARRSSRHGPCAARLRQRAHAHVPARACAVREPRAATSGPGASGCSPRRSGRRRSRPRGLRGRLPRDARRRVHGRRRVPLPRLREALAAAEAAAEAGIELVVLLRRVRARRQPARSASRRPPTYLGQVEALRGRGHPRRRRPPLRARLPARLARGDRPRTPSARACPARPRLRAAARDRGVPRRARHPADRAARRDRLPRAAHDGGPRHPRHATRARPDRRGRRARLPLPDDRGQPRRRLRAGRARCSSAASASASARTRTSASTRSRSCASSRASPGARRAGADVVPLDTLLCAGADEGAAALGLDDWPGIEVDTEHPSLRSNRRLRPAGRRRLRLQRRCRSERRLAAERERPVNVETPRRGRECAPPPLRGPRIPGLPAPSPGSPPRSASA